MKRNSVAKVSLKIIGVFVSLLILLGFEGTSIGQNGVVGVKLEEKRVSEEQAPIKITEYLVGEGDEWLKGLTIEVENVSTKPIYYFRYAGITENETNGGVGAHIPLLFNRELEQAAEREGKLLGNLGASPLNPGERVKIVIDGERYEWLKKRQASGAISPIKKIHFVLQAVYYGNGMRWMSGTELDYTKLVSSSRN